jgi:hypothetical protein
MDRFCDIRVTTAARRLMAGTQTNFFSGAPPRREWSGTSGSGYRYGTADGNLLDAVHDVHALMSIRTSLLPIGIASLPSSMARSWFFVVSLHQILTLPLKSGWKLWITVVRFGSSRRAAYYNAFSSKLP